MKRPNVMLLTAFALLTSCSTVFAQTLTTLVNFNSSNGDLPYSGLAPDASGNLYGTTFYGGTAGYGVVYKIDAITHVVTTVASFDDTNGANPVNYGRLVVDNSGNIFGTTEGGGPTHDGTIFEIPAGTHSAMTLGSFNQATTGSGPFAGVSTDGIGNLYGSTFAGGPGGGGTLFKFSTTTSTLTILASFIPDGPGPARPEAAPIVDARGNLFGTTGGGGGNNGSGTIYEIDAATHTFTVLTTFDGTTLGGPTGLFADGKGNFYGAGSVGGLNGSGGIFKFDSTTNALTTIHLFNGSDGATPPQSELAGDANGSLYGATFNGGANNLGTIFKFDPLTGAVVTLVSFDGAGNGANPSAGVFVDDAGNVYGTTTGGGIGRPYGLGTVFEISVPEPATPPLAALVALGFLASRRRSTLTNGIKKR